MNGTLRSLNHPLCHLAECPLWNEDEQCLYWTDVLERRIWRYDPAKDEAEEFWSGDMQVGGFAFCVDGGPLLCTDRGVFKLEPDRKQVSLLYDVGLGVDERFNDVTTDPAGRVFAGTMESNLRDGRLFRLEAGREPVCVLEGIGISNGMGFSVDQHFFYHTDSVRRTITRYRYDLQSGQLTTPETWYEADEADGCPDGMTVDSEDCVWVACWGGGQVIRLDSQGHLLSRIPVPAMQPSSVTFGGPAYRTLYITTASKGAADLKTGRDATGRFLGGRVYKMECDVTGRREWLARF